MRAAAARLLVLVVALAATGTGALPLAATATATATADTAATAPSAAAAPSPGSVSTSACGDGSGVTVVVQDGEAADASVRCATGDPATGLEALKGSGHVFTFMARQPGFVCTIDGKPDPCNNGPAKAYWSYWHAQPGGPWTYATTGAGDFDPRPGSIEGFSYGSGMPPSSPPPAAKAATGSPTPTTRANPTGATTPATPTTPATASSAPTPPLASGKAPAGSNAGIGGLATGIGLVILLGGGAGYLAWRRQQ